jgi:predicted RNA-binding Zn-ribbon protein involved in translation (DUF1610 family)
MVSRREWVDMTEKATVRIHKSDKERLGSIAEATGQNIADVIAEFVREPAYVCPDCGEPFDPAEVDAETVEEHGMLSTGVDTLVKGQRDVKSFECPCCAGRVRPTDIEAVEAEGSRRVTRRDVGITEENEEQEPTTEEA